MDAIKAFKTNEILVGIPEDKTARRDNSGEINNATILAINEYGSAANNIPPRPVLSIGLKNARDEITSQFKRAAQDVLSKGVGSLAPAYNRIGSIAANSVKKAINAQIGIEPPSESTLRSRRARGFKGEKALIVTGQMRNSITWVVK